jgi:hypothetical protein
MLYISIESLSSFSGKIGCKRGWVYTATLLSIISLLRILLEFPKKKGGRQQFDNKITSSLNTIRGMIGSGDVFYKLIYYKSPPLNSIFMIYIISSKKFF